MSREAWGDPPDPEPQMCPLCGEQWHAEGCELGAEVSRRLKAEKRCSEWADIAGAHGAEVDRLRSIVQQLQAAEEGAKDAFGVVVQEKHDALAECKRLRALLDAAYADQRRARIVA